jgi:hypothetical protein
VCWSRSFGTLGADLLLFVRCADARVTWTTGSSCGFSPTRRTSRLVPSCWERCSLSAVEGRVCWSRAAGMVGVDLLLFVHWAGTYAWALIRARVVLLYFLTYEKDLDFEAGFPS